MKYLYIKIRRVAETQMVSVHKRNIQGKYNSVRHLQLSIQLLQVQFRYRLKIPKIPKQPEQPEQDSGIHLKARYSSQAESDQSCTGIIIT